MLNGDSELGHSTGVHFVSRKASTLSSLISPSLFSSSASRSQTWLQTSGSFKCGHTRCITCNHINVTHAFTSTSTSRSYVIKDFINCNTRHVVYMATCLECSAQYVGCTTNALKVRIRRHISDTRNLVGLSTNTSGLSRLFQQTHQGDTRSLRVSGIERVKHSSRGGDFSKRLLHREAKWIFDLQTPTPQGLNLRSDILFQLH